MKKSADYVLVKNGEVINKPGKLPKSDNHTTNLHLLSDEALIELGWYPVKYTCPKCLKQLIYVVDEEQKCVIAKPYFEDAQTAKKQRRNQLWADSMHRLVTEGFYSTALGEAHLYSFDLIFPQILMLCIYNNKSLVIPCRLEDTVSAIEHSSEQLKQLSKDYSEFVTAHFNEVGEIFNDIQNAGEIEDIVQHMIQPRSQVFNSPFELDND